MKIFATVAAVAAALIFTSCATIAPKVPSYDTGKQVGQALYAGYVVVAADKDEEFRQQVADVWEKIDSIDSTDNLATDAAELALLFTDIESEKLTPEQLALCEALARLVLQRVDIAVKVKADENVEALEFLHGVRDGVDSMR